MSYVAKRVYQAMNLQAHINTELWLAVASTYGAENYKGAILEAMHLMTNLLRERAGTDGDGASLVGQALGGDNPKLRINKFQTQTEKDEQRGFEQLVRGLYTAIRNPRSHEQIQDTKDTADAIIYFINYIMSVLEKSKILFAVDDFLPRVFDPDFVTTTHYADLIVAEIPTQKRLEVLIELYRRKTEGDAKRLSFTVQSIIKLLTAEQVDQFMSVVSDELKVTHDVSSIRQMIRLVPPELWPKVQETARLRIENKIKEGIAAGTYDTYHGNVRPDTAVLSTWSLGFLPYFTLSRETIAHLLIFKLRKDQASAFYVVVYFLQSLPDLCNEKLRTSAIEALGYAIRKYGVNSKMREFWYNLPTIWQDATLASGETLQDLVFSDEEPEEIPF